MPALVKRHPIKPNRNRPDWKQLPRNGYTGPIPKWPAPKHDGKQKTWAEIWRCPQAAVWIDGGATLHRTIARYADLVWRTENLERYPVVILQEIRQLEDRLGLSPLAMRRNYMEVETEDQETVRLAQEKAERDHPEGDDGDNVIRAEFG